MVGGPGPWKRKVGDTAGAWVIAFGAAGSVAKRGQARLMTPAANSMSQRALC